MDERDKKILVAVIQSFIDTALPVGSRFISKRYDMGISSATIRNAMSDLEELGFLTQPHTSAGRVPTALGYKFYIDEIMGLDFSSDDELTNILYDKLVEFRGDLGRFMQDITRTLSAYSHFMGVTLSCATGNGTLREIEFFDYGEKGIVAVLLTAEGIVKHELIGLGRRYALTQNDLNDMARYINNEFAGLRLCEIRKVLQEDIYLEMAMRDDMVSRAINLCVNALASINSDVYIMGLSELLTFPDFNDIQKIKDISNDIEDKSKILALLDRISTGEGVQVFVGQENDAFTKDHGLSLVASAFHDKGGPCGVVGLIGPRRMNYTQAISIVGTSVRFLSGRLQHW
jgi:heat-inducible transcriptional repressor